MTDTSILARAIVETISTCAIPSSSDLHDATRDAQLAREASLIERFASIAGVDLEDVAVRLECSSSIVRGTYLEPVASDMA